VTSPTVTSPTVTPPTVTPPVVTTLEAPTGVTVRSVVLDGKPSGLVNWNAVQGADGYKVRWSLLGTDFLGQIIPGSAGGRGPVGVETMVGGAITSHSIPPFQDTDVPLTVDVVATLGTIESPHSNRAMTILANAPPSAPQGPRITVQDDTITCAWSEPAFSRGLYKYQVRHKIGAFADDQAGWADVPLDADGAPTIRSYTVENLALGDYNVEVRALNEIGGSEAVKLTASVLPPLTGKLLAGTAADDGDDFLFTGAPLTPGALDPGTFTYTATATALTTAVTIFAKLADSRASMSLFAKMFIIIGGSNTFLSLPAAGVTIPLEPAGHDTVITISTFIEPFFPENKYTFTVTRLRFLPTGLTLSAATAGTATASWTRPVGASTDNYRIRGKAVTGSTYLANLKGARGEEVQATSHDIAFLSNGTKYTIEVGWIARSGELLRANEWASLTALVVPSGAATLTFTPAAARKTYGQADPVYSAAGFLGADDEGSVFTAPPFQRAAGEDAGEYAYSLVDPQPYAGSFAATYQVVLDAPPAFTITPAEVVYLSTAADKVYDGRAAAPPDLGGSLSGAVTAMLNGVRIDDTSVRRLTVSGGVFADKNVGNDKPLSGFAPAGAAAANYTLGAASSVRGAITKRPLRVPCPAR